jgi:hypothetical protein
VRRRYRPAVGANVFAFMFGLESITRALLAAVIPLQAYEILKDARDVSLVYFASSTLTLVATFFIPQLTRIVGRGRLYEAGALCLVLAPVFFVTLTVTGQIGGMWSRAFGSACLNVAIALYMMEFVAKQDLVRAEPKRYFAAAGAWVIGPTLGGVLYAALGPWAAHGASFLCGLAVLANYRWIAPERSARTAVAPAAPNPLVNVARFIGQRRLVIAWSVAFGRTAWWNVFLSYGPLYLLEAGLSRIESSALASAGSAMLFATPLWGRLAGWIGVRATVVLCFVWMAGMTLLACFLSSMPIAAAACLVIAAAPAAGLDAIGNIPFLRLVRAAERPQMTPVFRTYIETADLTNSIVFALLLSFFPLSAVFAASAATCLGFAFLSRYLPRGL